MSELDGKMFKKIFENNKKKMKERDSLKLRQPIIFAYLERSKTGCKVDGVDEVNIELKAKKLRTYGDVLAADKLETLPNVSYERQILWELVYQLLIDRTCCTMKK